MCAVLYCCCFYFPRNPSLERIFFFFVFQSCCLEIYRDYEWSDVFWPSGSVFWCNVVDKPAHKVFFVFKKIANTYFINQFIFLIIFKLLEVSTKFCAHGINVESQSHLNFRNKHMLNVRSLWETDTPRDLLGSLW